MDIRYFAHLDRLKRGDKHEDACLRGETDNHTRLLPGELGVQIPPGARIPPHLAAVDGEAPERAETRARLLAAALEAERSGLYDRIGHDYCRFCSDAGLDMDEMGS